MIELNQWIPPLLGGALIGIASLLLLLFNGRIAGISGILSGLGSLGSGEYWRVAFIVGLLAGGFGWFFIFPNSSDISSGVSLPVVIVGGILVGLGTRLGSGCTSGHGVCGLSRFSVRSIVAVCVFLLTAVITATSAHLMKFGG